MFSLHTCKSKKELVRARSLAYSGLPSSGKAQRVLALLWSSAEHWAGRVCEKTALTQNEYNALCVCICIYMGFFVILDYVLF